VLHAPSLFSQERLVKPGVALITGARHGRPATPVDLDWERFAVENGV